MQQRSVAVAIAAAFSLPLALPFSAVASDGQATVVVTATRTPVQASEVLNDITVLDRSDIEASGAATLPELLAAQPGVQFVTNGGVGKTASLFLRGAESRHTVVLVDGMRINSATGGDTAVQHIPLSQIERIEIVRGPVSSLYGSEAIGGVVQVFTRRGEGALNGNVEASYGSRNTSDVSAGVSGASNAFDYALSAGHFQTDGVSVIANPKNASYNPDADGYRQDNAAGRVGMRLASGHELAANVFYSDSVSRYDALGAGSYDARIDQTLQGVGIESKNRFAESWTSTLRVADSTDDMTNHAKATSTTAFKTEQKQATWQNDFRTPLGSILAGVERLEQTIASTTAYTTKERTVDSLLFGYMGRLEAHRLQISARRDDNSQFGARTTGMACYGYQILSVLRASVGVGTSFSAPTFNQLYFPGFGNPDLKPERGRNKEATLAWDNGHARAALTRYDNRVTDLIQSVQVAPGVYLAENVQRAKLAGWTLVVEANRFGWRPRLAYDQLDATDEATGLVLPRRAREHLTLGVAKEMEAFTVNGEVVASSHRYDNAANTRRLAGYAVVNAGLDYRYSTDTTLFARAVNILDKRYELAADYATTRASLFVGVRQRFN
jgi:vitamin B12 transporter